MHAGVLWGNLKVRCHLEELDVDGMMICGRTIKFGN